MRALGAANFCKKGVTVGNKGRRITTVNSRRIFYSFPTTTGAAWLSVVKYAASSGRYAAAADADRRAASGVVLPICRVAA